METQKIFSIVDTFKQHNPHGVVIIWWATATGKSGLAVEIARLYNKLDTPVEIIWADSRQIYTYMDIWTDKVSKEIRKEIPHHQIDIVSPDRTYTAWEWKDDTCSIINTLHRKNVLPIVTWGTGLYIDTLYKNFSMPNVPPDYDRRDQQLAQEKKNPGFLYARLEKVDPEEAMKQHPNNSRHILRAIEIYEKSWQTKTQLAKQHPVERPMLMLWLWREKEDTNKRINKRIKEMVQEWLIDEVESLLKQWYTLDDTAMNWIGYKEIVWYLQGAYDLERAQELLRRNTHRYAKSQRTWFRRYIAYASDQPKDNVTYHVEYL